VVRSVLQDALALTSLTLFLAAIAVWARVLGVMWCREDRAGGGRYFLWVWTGSSRRAHGQRRARLAMLVPARIASI